jgi:long-chain fatty acid transport protein
MSGIVNNLLRFLLTVLIFKSCVGRLWANGFGLPDQDAFAMGRGEAFVATADNPSAIYYNPAGITQIKGDSLRGGLYGLYYDTSYRPPAGRPNSGSVYHGEANLAAVPQVFYVHSLEKLPLSVGLGVYFPFGGNMDWPQDTGFRQVAVSASLKYVTINPTIAWRIVPSFSVAAGAMVNYADMKTSQGILASSGIPNYFNFEGSGWSAGYNVGILWKPIKKVSIGATFRSAAEVSLDGETHYESFPIIAPERASTANMHMTFPWTVVGGISFRPTQKWNLELDANYTSWSTLGTFNLFQANPPSSLQNPNTQVNFDWRGSWIIESGVTRYFSHGWHASAGYAFNQNSVPNSFYTPWVADLNRHLFSLGVGRTGKRFDIDVAYQLGYGPPHTVTGSNASLGFENQTLNHVADGQYGFFSSAFVISAGIHF